MMTDVFTNPIKIGAVVTSLASFTGFFYSDTISNANLVNPKYELPIGIYAKCDSTSSAFLSDVVFAKPFEALSSEYVIDPINEGYVNAFNFALTDLMTLRNYIMEVYGDVSVKLEPYTANKEAGLLVVIQGTGKVSDDINNLQTVCEKWFENTELDVSKNIYIDVMG